MTTKAQQRRINRARRQVFEAELRRTNQEALEKERKKREMKIHASSEV